MLGFVLNRENRPVESLEFYTKAAAITRPTADDLKIVGLDYVLLDDYAERPHYQVVERFADLEMAGRMAVLRPRRLIDRIQVRRMVRQFCADPR